MTTVFVGSYAPAETPGIHVFDLAADGSLRLLAAQPGVANPSFLALDPAGRYLFAVAETGHAADGVSGQVHSFRIERPTLRLVMLDMRPSGGDHPCHIAIDRRSRWLAVSNYSSGNVTVLPVSPDGTLGEAATSLQHSGRGAHPDRQSGPHAHSAIFTPDNRFLITADLGIDRLNVNRFHEATGECEPVLEVSTGPGAGPRHMAFHPDGTHLFVVNELDNTLALYRFESETGTLRMTGTRPTVPDSSTDNLAADVHISPSGRYVYVSNRGDDSIAVFAFDPIDGLSRLVVAPSGGKWPRGFDVTPDGISAIVAHRRSDEVVVLPFLAGGAEVGAPSGRAQIPQPSCIVVA